MSRSKKRIETIKKRYGDNFFRVIGQKGGLHSTSRPFKDVNLASAAGKKSHGGGRPKKLDTANNTSA